MPRIALKSLKNDYSNVYNRMMDDYMAGADLSVKGPKNFIAQSAMKSPNYLMDSINYYISHLCRWHTPSVFPYSFTLSPKSSPLMKGKSISQQYSILVAYLKQTLPLYSNKYFMTFETYTDNINLHVHGYMQFRTIDNIKKFRKDAREHFNIKLKQREKDPLTHIKLIGNDEEQRKRWTGYLYKEMVWAIKNNLNPICRWDDEFIEPITVFKQKKPTKYSMSDILPIITLERDEAAEARIALIHLYAPNTNIHKTQEAPIELESETDDEPESDFYEDYNLFLRLKNKYEKNLKNI